MRSKPTSFQHQALTFSFLLLFLVPLCILFYGLERTQFFPLIACYGGMFLLYAGVLRTAKSDREIQLATFSGILFRGVILFAIPSLSDDFYRFVWDGHLLVGGENPFLHLPKFYMEQLSLAPTGITPELFESLNSKEYFTVYPPILQAGFWLSSVIDPGNYPLSIFLLKTLIFIAEVGSLFFIARLVHHFQLPKKSILVYALNPLVIVELGNIHFDAFMICFLLGAVYFLAKQKWTISAIFYGFAIGAKIIPVMFLPFLIRRLGWKKSIGYFAVTGGVALLLFAPILTPELLLNFAQSLKLYFAKFEFNASFYYFIRGILGGGIINRILGIVFPIIIFLGILRMAQKEIEPKWKTLPAYILFALTLYYLLATTVHPWYLTSFVAFAALSGYRYPLVWSGMITLTYITYIVPGEYVEWNSVIFLEYSVVLAFLGYEILLKRKGLTLEEWVLGQPRLRTMVEKTIPGRVKIKLDRIHRHILPGEKVLDIGCGNGGLAHSLKMRGVDLTPLDVKNISFFEDVEPVIYDGKQIPYAENAFDRALLTTVLHHIPNPEETLAEAVRVAPKLIVMEDIYSNFFQKHLTFFMDSLVNFEFEGHPHTNKTDAEWRALFTEMGLKVVEVEYLRTLVLFRQVVYVLEKA